MKVLLGDINAKRDKENIFKVIIEFDKKSVMIMKIEDQTLPYLNISQSKVQRS
jgi:hypothetical protein